MLVTEQERLRDELVELADRFGRARSALMPMLQEVQRKHFHISQYCMQIIADLLDIHPVEVQSVISFYSFLDQEPLGQFVIRLCRTITCEMAGKEHVARQLVNDLGIRFSKQSPRIRTSLATGTDQRHVDLLTWRNILRAAQYVAWYDCGRHRGRRCL